MNFKNILNIFLIYQKIICESFITKNTLKYSIINFKHNNIKISDTYNINLINNKKIYFHNIVENLKKKTNSFFKLIRYKNIPCTLLLSFSSGFIINKSFFKLFNSKKFMISTLITVLIMSCSMIINDIFDIIRK